MTGNVVNVNKCRGFYGESTALITKTVLSLYFSVLFGSQLHVLQLTGDTNGTQHEQTI